MLIVGRAVHEWVPKEEWPVLDFSEYLCTRTMSDVLGKPFLKRFSHTVRCGGRSSGIEDRHNWDSYRIVIGGSEEVYTLTIQDAMKLQGFEDSFKLRGSDTQRWRMLGNTIPIVFTRMIGERLSKVKSRTVCLNSVEQT